MKNYVYLLVYMVSTLYLIFLFIGLNTKLTFSFIEITLFIIFSGVPSFSICILLSTMENLSGGKKSSTTTVCKF